MIVKQIVLLRYNALKVSYVMQQMLSGQLVKR